MSEPLRDRSLSFLSQPYDFVAEQCRAEGTDVFETRLLLHKTVCMQGAEATRFFYSQPKLQRDGAAPEPVRATLFGKDGVQSLDGEAHRVRRALLLSVLAPENVARLARRVRRYWGRHSSWAPKRYRLPLYETSQHVLTLSVCEWLGVPVRDGNLAALSAQLSSLFHDAAGPGHLRARRARGRLERWLAEQIETARNTRPDAEVSPLFNTLAQATDPETGRLLSPRVAAVELLNLMRPVVAVSVYIVWMAHALLCHPEVFVRLRKADADYRRAFVDEVRRFYPFFPAVMARVSDPFAWRGHQFTEGMRVMLDLHSTNHDSRSWNEPQLFQPERFLNGDFDADAFIPQGGGDAVRGHRCPGEAATVAVMLASLDFVMTHLPPRASGHDLGILRDRMPAIPAMRIYIGE